MSAACARAAKSGSRALRLDRHKRYEEFLKRVLNADSHADTYSDVNDLLNRHKTLQDAYDVRAVGC